MLESTHRNLDKETMNKFLELPHKVNEVRYIGFSDENLFLETTHFRTGDDLYLHIENYVRHFAENQRKLEVNDLKQVSLIKVVYLDIDMGVAGRFSAGHVEKLSTGLYAHLNTVELIVALYEEAVTNKALEAKLTALFDDVKNMKSDYNEFKFFHKLLNGV